MQAVVWHNYTFSGQQKCHVSDVNVVATMAILFTGFACVT